nr:sulfotransferase [Sphingomonas chungangi]
MALRDGIEHPLVLDLAAGRLEEEGKPDEALVLLLRAKQLAPRAPGILNALGLCLQRLDRHEEAAEEFGAALAAVPDFPQARANRGVALTAQSRLVEARQDFEATLAIQPDNLVALNGLAGLAARRGAPAEARALAERVLMREPNFPGAILAIADADIAEGRASDGITRLTRLLSDKSASPIDRALAQGLLGDALDALGRAADAFTAYRQAGEQFRTIYADRFAGAETPQTFIRALRDQLSSGSVARAKSNAATGPARRHIFLVGFPRSGTTLLEQVLEQHPDVVTLAEKECLIDSIRIATEGAGRFAAFSQQAEIEIDGFRQAYWRRVGESVQVTGQVFVDKHPFHSFKLPLIARLFPEARIIFAQRDPRDVVLSCFRHRFRMSGPTFQFLTLLGTASLYAETMELIEATASVFSPPMLRCRLEDLIADFEGRTRALCDWLSIRWTAELARFAEKVGERGVFTPSAAQLAGGLSDRGVARWQAYEAGLAPVMPLLDPWVKRFGYA